MIRALLGVAVFGWVLVASALSMLSIEFWTRLDFLSPFSWMIFVMAIVGGLSIGKLLVHSLQVAWLVSCVWLGRKP